MGAAGIHAVQRRVAATLSPAAAEATVLECFQVAQPVLMPHGTRYRSVDEDGVGMSAEITNPAISNSESCTVVLMDHVFANSYGQPFVGGYTGPWHSYQSCLKATC